MIFFEKDEHIRSDATTESMAKLRTVFKKDGSVTAGNASGLNDAASAVILMERSQAEKEGKEILGRLVGYHTPLLIRNTWVSGLFQRFKSV